LAPLRRWTFLLLLMAGGVYAWAPPPEQVPTIFYLRWEEKLTGPNIRYEILVESQFALMDNDEKRRPDGQYLSSAALFRQRDGFLGLKPGEQLNLFSVEETGSGQSQEVGFKPCVGKHTAARNGFTRTWTDGKMESTPKRHTQSGAYPPGAYSEIVEATLTRRAQGAVLTYQPRALLSDCEYQSSPLVTNGFTEAQQASIGSFEFSEAQLKDWSAIQMTKGGVMEKDEHGSVLSLKVTLRGSLVTSGEDELIFVPTADYDSWIPTPMPERLPGIVVTPPASLLSIKVRIQPKSGSKGERKDTIYFSLEDVARHKGRCGNYPRNALEKDDLRFAAEQPEGIVIDGPKDAHTREEVAEATIAIEATDTAAYGKVTARASALKLKAIYKPTNQYVLVVPRDDDGNKIADAWERLNGAQRNVMADKESVAGQDRAGDGLTVFDEYRGLVVLESGIKTLKRLSPQVKEIFVVDTGGSFDSAVWQRASDVKAYKVDETMLAGGGHAEESRVINFNADDGDHKKYAVRVETMPGDSDPDDPQKKNTSTGQTSCGECRSPKDADYCRIFPYRIRVLFEDLYRWLTLALTKQGSEESQELDASGYARWLAQRALDKLKDPAARQAMVKQMITQVTIHEVGHAVGLKDHEGGVPAGTPESAAGTIRECPMYYPSNTTYRRWIILQSLFRPQADMPMRYVQFCRGLAAMQGDGYNCHARVNVSDW
jgi:hypothetical protein